MEDKNRPTLVIMAAGMGSRYGGLKQLDSVGPGGELLINYTLYDARLSGFERVDMARREGYWENKGTRQFYSTWHVLVKKV